MSVDSRIETSFLVGGRQVAAVIDLPDSDSPPFPGVVLVDGSGPSDRHSFGPQPQWFLDAGFAVLTHDKPGCGNTRGDWREQSLEDRADETRAAFETLRAHERVDGDRVGLWAASQGGWVAPLVAADHPRVAFMILVSSAAVSPFEQEAASLKQRMREAGEPDEFIELAATAFCELVERLRSGDTRENVSVWFRSVQAQSRFNYFHSELFSDAAILSFVARVGDHDPIPALLRVVCPVLLVFGANDTLVPVAQSRRIFVEQLHAAGNQDVSVEVFAGADHWLRIGTPDLGSDSSRPLAPGYVALMTNWARARAF